jgi:hypothetical protein
MGVFTYRRVLTQSGQHAVSASDDQTQRGFGREGGAEVATFTSDGAAYCCSAGQRIIVAGDESGRIHLLCLGLQTNPFANKNSVPWTLVLRIDLMSQNPAKNHIQWPAN